VHLLIIWFSPNHAIHILRLRQENNQRTGENKKMDEKEKVTTPCHDNQLLLEFARGRANAWKRLQEKALSGWCPENSEELERYAFRKRMEAEEEMQKIIEDLRICSITEEKQGKEGVTAISG